jgi:hypothetical protein
MKLGRAYKASMILSLIVLLGFAKSSVATSPDYKTIQSAGSIMYWPRVDVTVNTNKTIGLNNLSLGFMLDYEWKIWRDRPVLRELAQNANYKLVRIFDFRKSPSLVPCTYWNESTKTGIWNWADVDLLVQRIFAVGAEPLFTLGCPRSSIINYIPAGMTVNPSTGLPYPDSWAAYCKEWPRHFKNTGVPVRFYETMNEPWMYFGWDDYAKIANFMALFNAAAQAMRAEDPNVLVSFDGTNRKPVLDYWLANGGADLGFISFHKYDAWDIGQYTDQAMLDRAETYQLKTSLSYYGIQDAKQKYYNARGKWIPAINSESNFNSAYETGTDPRIQQMVGAVWEALVLRTEVLEGASYNVYYTFASSASWERTNKPSGGTGFGMVNYDNNNAWYPYYVHEMFGNISAGDRLIESVSSSGEIRALVWIHDFKTHIVLICKVDQARTVFLEGLPGLAKMVRIDSTIPWETPRIQEYEINLAEPIVMNGYTVALLQVL